MLQELLSITTAASDAITNINLKSCSSKSEEQMSPSHDHDCEKEQEIHPNVTPHDALKQGVFFTDVDFKVAKMEETCVNIYKDVTSLSTAADVIVEKFDPKKRETALDALLSSSKPATSVSVHPPIRDAPPQTVRNQEKKSTENIVEALPSVIGPFIKIQSALEEQIVSLVSSVNMVHQAEKKLLYDDKRQTGCNAVQLTQDDIQSKICEEKVDRVLKELNEFKKLYQFENEQTRRHVQHQSVVGEKSSILDRPHTLNDRLELERKPSKIYRSPSHLNRRPNILQTPVPRKSAPKPFTKEATYKPDESGEESKLFEEIMKECGGDVTPQQDICEQYVSKDRTSHTVGNSQGFIEIEKKKESLLLDHSLSEECPIDKLLSCNKMTLEIMLPDKCATYKDDAVTVSANQALREAQEAQKQLQITMSEVLRKHEQHHIFGYLQSPQKDGELIRIRKTINENIKEIEKEIQHEIFTQDKNVVKKKHPSTKLPGSRLYTKPRLKECIKIEERRKPDKVTQGKVKTKPPPTSQLTCATKFDQLLNQHFFGNRPHRNHSRQPVNERQQRVLKPATPAKSTVNKENTITHVCCHDNLPNNVPLVRELIPSAIPLANPCTDPLSRLPIQSSTDKVSKQQKPTISSRSQVSNVAVVNIKSCYETSQLKARLKNKVRQRVKSKLAIQSLPPVDIDTQSYMSEETSSKSTTKPKHKSLIHSLSSPKGSEVPNDEYNFQEYLAVEDLSKVSSQQDETTLSEDNLSMQKDPFDIVGHHHENRSPNEESGPCFPPQHSKDMQYVVPTAPSCKLQQQTQEWLEQEILARILVQLNEQTIQPSLNETAKNAKTTLINNGHTSPQGWIDNVIGLQGVQLFVDAGVPVDADLVDEMVRNVVVEKLEMLFGHPKPVEQRKTISAPSPLNHVTPLPTPQPTPPPSASPSFVTLHTPEQSLCELKEQNINDQDGKDDSINEISEHSLVETPLHSLSEEVKPNSPPKPRIDTPEGSCDSSHSSMIAHRIETPKLSQSLIEPPFISQDEFVETDPPEEEEVSRLTLRPSPLPPTTIPSTISSTLNTSSSVGTSSFECISVGEYLSTRGVISRGSLGELGLPHGVSMLDVVKEIPEDILDNNMGENVKLMIQDLIRSCDRPPPIRARNVSVVCESDGELVTHTAYKSAGEIPSPQDETEWGSLDFAEDTLNLIDDENKDDPVTRLLLRIYPQKEHESAGEILDGDTLNSVKTFCQEPLSIGQLVKQSQHTSSERDEARDMNDDVESSCVKSEGEMIKLVQYDEAPVGEGDELTQYDLSLSCGEL